MILLPSSLIVAVPFVGAVAIVVAVPLGRDILLALPMAVLTIISFI